MSSFALAHMSCAGAWAWGRVPELLRAAGHEVHAPDLECRVGVTPNEHARALPAADVVVGHSYGALVALATGAPRVVLIDGPLVRDGECAFDLLPERGRREEAARDGMWVGGPRSQPWPISAMTAPVRVASLPEHGTYVLCEPETFGESASRARALGWRIVDAPGDHLLPLEDPEHCAAILLDALA